MEAIRSSLRGAWRHVRRLPPGYLVAIVALLTGGALLAGSLVSQVVFVDVVVLPGEAPPGTSEQEVPLNSTSLFRATLEIQSCAVAFHLLTDSEYEAFLASGSLPPPTLNCYQAEAVVRSRVGHMVTVYPAPSNASSVPYQLTADVYAERHPYTLLSIPGAFLGMAGTISLALTVMNRGTEKLTAEFRERRRLERRRK